MTSETNTRTLGQAIDAMVEALRGLDEGQKTIAMKTVAEALGIRTDTPPKPFGGDAELSREHSTTSSPAATMAPGIFPPAAADIRSLKNLKKPGTAQEMACVVAFYLQSLAPEEERKATVSGNDLDKYFRQADFPLPTRMGQLLLDSRAAGYFEPAARGTYRLNPVGYNLVAHTLPRTGKRVVASRSPKKASPKKRK